MKRTLLDKVIGAVSPEAGFKRLQARAKTELALRAYDAAKSFNTDDWTSATKGSANIEIRGAQGTLRAKGRDAVRNNPYAGRGLAAIVSNTVGSGIMPNIKGKTTLQTKKMNAAWKEWGESTLCDSLGRNNFYGLQALALRSTVESGEVILLKEVNRVGDTAAHQLKLLESDFIVTFKDTLSLDKEGQIVQGVKTDASGKPVSYFIYNFHPGEAIASTQYQEIPASKVCHVFRQDRPGQHRGVSWFHPVIRQMADFNEYQQATLISKKVEACFSAIVTTSDSDSALSSSDLQKKREAETMLSPGSFKYLNPGEAVSFSQPAAVSGYDEYCRQVLRSIASGLGITYEALTSDYSNVNFSSGRMGHLEFRRNVDMWRWSMLIPTLCDPAYQHFLDWCKIAKGIVTDGSTCEWVPPAWSMIDPEKEIAAFKNAVRSGFTSYTKAVREQGNDPSELLAEIKTNNDLLDELGIIIDSDPRKTTGAGIFQIVPGTNPTNPSGDNNVAKADQKTPTSS